MESTARNRINGTLTTVRPPPKNFAPEVCVARLGVFSEGDGNLDTVTVVGLMCRARPTTRCHVQAAGCSPVPPRHPNQLAEAVFLS
jgi:hypothetical protein